MSIAKMILAGASALCVLTSVASAEPLTGRVMGINRLTNTIAIQQMQDGTVGANGGSATEDDIIGFARERLAHFKAPRGVTFVSELPKTATGKIQKFVLRQGAPNLAHQ